MIRFAKPVLLSLLVVQGVLLGAACTGDVAKTPQAPPPPPVVVGQAVRRAVPVSVRGIGNVESVASVAVRSRVAGQILKVHISDGADVSKGQTLFTIDPAPYALALAQAEAALSRDKALVEKAENDAARYAKLVEKGYVTREQYESAISTAGSLSATVRSDQAVIDEAELSLSYCTIAAPIAGKAGSVNLRAGNLVKISDDPPLVTILQVRPINVIFSLPEKYLQEVRARSARGRLAVRVTARGDASEGHLGQLAFIDNTVDTTTGTIRLKAEFPNDDRGLWPGQFVQAEMVLSEQQNALVVPSTAIQVGQSGSYVFVVGADGTAQVRPVVVDRSLGDETVLSSGLDGGETVITDGQIRVVPGAKVSVSAKS